MDTNPEAVLLKIGAREFASPDALGAVAAHVEREYGFGYRIGIIRGQSLGGAYFEVCASDGSRFVLEADRWGNVRRVEGAAR